MGQLSPLLAPGKMPVAVMNSILTGASTIMLVYDNSKTYLDTIWLIAVGITILLIITRLFFWQYGKRIENDKGRKKRKKNYSLEKIKNTKLICKNCFYYMLIFTLVAFAGYRLYEYEKAEQLKTEQTEHAKVNAITSKIGAIIDRHQNSVQPLPDVLDDAEIRQDPDCLTALGYLYMTGFDNKAKIDYTKAKDYFEKACGGARSFVAEYYLGYMYYQGLGVNPDRRTALEWHKKSADKGYHMAQAFYGSNLYYGHIIKQNLEEAERYLTMAAKQNNINAQKTLGIHYMFNHNYDAGEYWYAKAAENNDPPAQAIHGGNLYRKKKYKEAFFWLSKSYSADKNDINSLRNLGLCYRDGKAVEKDLEKAERFFMRAIQLHNTSSSLTKLNLAELYYETENYEGAMKLAKEAQKANVEGAKDLIKKLEKRTNKYA